jgi:hypothetical protein
LFAGTPTGKNARFLAGPSGLRLIHCCYGWQGEELLMQWFTDGDKVLILARDAGLKRTEIFLQVGIPERSQTHELSRESRRGPHHASLKEAVREKIRTLRWGQEAEDVIEEIDDLTKECSWSKINKRFRFFVKITRDRSIEIVDRGDIAVSNDDFGLVLVHYFFATAMRFSRMAVYNTPENVEMFDHGRDFCLKVLAAHTETWAAILQSRLATTSFAAIWNSTARENRDSPAMRSLVGEYKLFDKLRYLNDLCPKHLGAPFNALAAASRFKDCAKYPEWWGRLVTAAPQFKHPKKVRDAFFDDDFEDFRLWAVNNPDGYELKGDEQ